MKEREAGELREGMEVNGEVLLGMQPMCVERGLLEVVRGGAMSGEMKGVKIKVEERKRACEEWLQC